MNDTICWGILSTGYIAHQFVEGLSALPEARIVAVGSRNAGTASAFAAQYNIPRSYSSYGELASDPEIDAIYIGTPHRFHKENTLLCLSAGKAVLCEKPLTTNASDAQAVVQTARENNLFLMEAMWSRFLPALQKAKQMIDGGVIGDIQIVASDFGFTAPFDPKSRLYDPELGGGSLLDVGIYPVSLASMFLGPPQRIVSMGQIGRTGVDEQSAVIFGYDSGALAVGYATIRCGTYTEATIAGSGGMIRLHAQVGLFRPYRLSLRVSGREDEVIEVPYEGNGYNYEAAEVIRRLRAGEIESPVMPLDESVEIIRTMDKIRAQWSLKYPADR
ncbi:MAG: Gfo/Idh/MocA family oxidoreductase [Spirochaetales bacterium]|nr:Gfo/Idh/MocA family oxidoreductase [Spirochaetales bacterium]